MHFNILILYVNYTLGGVLMIIVDAHCDTISKILDHNENLFKNNNHLDLERLQKYDSYLQFFAAFIHPEYSKVYALERALSIIDKYFNEIENNSSIISHCNNIYEIQTAFKQNKIASILTIEGGEALHGKLSLLRMFYRIGVRSLCLTWNNRNEIAGGVEDSYGEGLTEFGFSVINEMNRIGMIIDLSHISEKGFWDVLNNSKYPVIASHSNVKQLCNHKRNLDDNQIRAIKNVNGVIGINFYPEFLNDNGKAGINDIIKHIEYINSLVGVDHVGLGSDFDGIEQTPYNIMGIQDISKLFSELQKLNYSDEIIEKITGKNFIRVMNDVFNNQKSP